MGTSRRIPGGSISPESLQALAGPIARRMGIRGPLTVQVTFLPNRVLQRLKLRHLGHRMKGVGTSYGFTTVSEIGKRIENGARGSDRNAIEACIGEYADYLSKVQVVYE